MHTSPDTRFASLIHNRHQGERVIIVANGPSLNQMDLGFLKNEITFGLNKIYLGFRKFRFYPKYYVAVNRKVIEQSAEYIRKLNCVKFISDRGHDLVPPDALTYQISTKKPEQQFYKDISLGVNEGWTVTYAALQVAYYMGFTEVILIGLDHRYVFSGNPNQADVLAGPDPNHFSPEYFGFGKTWDNPDLQNAERSFVKAREVYERTNRRIYDATVNGACTVFEKINYKDL